jgi:hypothetical protein
LVNEAKRDDYKEAFVSQIQCSALSGASLIAGTKHLLLMNELVNWR